MADISAVFSVKWTNGGPVLPAMNGDGATLASLEGSGWRLLGDPPNKAGGVAVLVTTSKAQMDALKALKDGNATAKWDIGGKPDKPTLDAAKASFGFTDREYTELLKVVVK